MNYSFDLSVNDLVTSKLLKIQNKINKLNPFDRFNREGKEASIVAKKVGYSFQKVSGSVKELNALYAKNRRSIIAIQRATLTANKKEKTALNQQIKLMRQKNREIRESIKLQKTSGRTSYGGGMMSAMGTLGKIGMIGGAVAGVGRMVGGTLKGANVQQQAEAQVQAGMKSTGNAAGFSMGQYKQMAGDLQKKSLFGDEDILKNVTAQFQTFTNISGNAFKNAQQNAVDMAAKTGNDLKGISVMMGKALNNPIKGVSALTRMGVEFTDAQKEQIKYYQEAGDLASAQAIINKELQVEFGGSAEAAAKAGLGPMKQLGMTIGDLGETFGALLLPAVNKLSTWLKDIVIKVDSFVQSDKFKAFLDKTKAIFNNIWNAVKEPLMNIWNAIKSFFITFKRIFSKLFANFNKVGGFFSQIGGYLKTLFSVIGKIVKFILKLAEVLGTILMPVFKAIFKVIGWFYSKILQPIISWIGNVITWLTKLMDKILLKRNKGNQNVIPQGQEINVDIPDQDEEDGKTGSFFGGFTPGNNNDVSGGLKKDSVQLQTNRQIKNYTFNIESLVNELTIETTELKESEMEVQDIITRMLRKAVIDTRGY